MSPMQAAGLYVPGEHGSELSAVDLRGGVVVLVGDERGEHGAVLVEPAIGLSFESGEGVELVEQAGVFDGDLPGVGVQVERATRVAGVGGCVGVVHRDV